MVTASAERYLLQVAVGRSTHEKLRHAQALLSHAVPDGDVAQVLDRALDVLIAQLEKRKFAVDAKFGAGAKVGAGSEMKPQGRPNGSSRPPAGTRYVPAHIRSAVWERDQGQCTFVSASGHRCGARRFLEFDHVDPVARGGGATVERMRLRCRAHNQYEAERAFGAGFMEEKRRTARRAAAEAAARTADMEATRDLLAGLRSLGCRGQEARRAAEHALGLDGASLEQRMRAALKFLGQESIQGRGRVSAGLIHGSG